LKEIIMATTVSLETRAAPLPLTESEILYEVVNGRRVEPPPMGILSTRLASRLGRRLGTFADDNGLGDVEVEMLFILDEAEDLQRRPDVAFVSYERWPRSRPVSDDEAAWNVVPDLAVEVVSPTDRDEAGLAKVREYFQAGVRLVWKVYPRERVVHVYETFTTIRVLTRADELDGGEVVPGFRLPLTMLFEEETPDDQPPS
jgi:Uma2 family endonuclease